MFRMKFSKDRRKHPVAPHAKQNCDPEDCPANPVAIPVKAMMTVQIVANPLPPTAVAISKRLYRRLEGIKIEQPRLQNKLA